MARIFFAVAVLLSVLALIPLLAGNVGYVLISFGDWAIDGTMIAFIVWAFLALLIIWIVFFVLIKSRRLGRAIARFFSFRSEEKINADVESGLVAFAEQDWAQAQTVLERVAEHTDQTDSMLMLAAYAASHRQQTEQALALVHKIESSALQYKAKKLLVELGDAELINKLQGKKPDPVLAVSLAIKQQNWQQAGELLARLKPSRKVSAETVEALHQQVIAAWMPDLVNTQSVDAMLTAWKGLPKKDRLEWQNVNVVVPLLLANGRQDDAMVLLKPWLKQRPDDAVIDSLSAMPWNDVMPLNKVVQKWLKSNEEDVVLLSALGMLAHHAGEHDLARKALIKIVEQRDRHDVWSAYAEACQQSGDKDNAMLAYQRAATAR